MDSLHYLVLNIQNIETLYLRQLGKCDFIAYDGSVQTPPFRSVLYGVGFSVPCMMTTLSYLFIWWQVYSNDKQLKSVAHRFVMIHLSKIFVKVHVFKEGHKN